LEPLAQGMPLACPLFWCSWAAALGHLASGGSSLTYDSCEQLVDAHHTVCMPCTGCAAVEKLLGTAGLTTIRQGSSALARHFTLSREPEG
jgi:hypothetical protein